MMRKNLPHRTEIVINGARGQTFVVAVPIFLGENMDK
jgi:hypothetical protein